MYILAYALVLIAFVCALGGSAFTALVLLQGREKNEAVQAPRFAEYANGVQMFSLLTASAILVHALYNYDFSVIYVASYTDLALPVFYRLTAFWAGQAGSLLFWAFSVVIAGTIFQFTTNYKRLPTELKLWYWVFYFLITAFFNLLLSGWNNPFMTFPQALPDGNGLNPLLQNPGMILHPPILFLGYGGFIIPTCLALGQSFSSYGYKQLDWSQISRPFTITGWIFLTAGIILGCWWAYMELGWGGYWAWDPVENASLLPWLVSTAALHTIIIQNQRNKLYRTNVFLITLTTISAFFATYLVRGNIVDSLHAFGDDTIATPLLIFIIGSIIITIIASVLAKNEQAAPLSEFDSREGFLLLTKWLLLFLCVIIAIATMWPVISLATTGEKIGLEADFYNKVCLPLFTIITILLAVCPWMGWKHGIRDARRLGITLGAFIAATCAIWALGYRMPVMLISAGAAVAAMVSALLYALEKGAFRHLPRIGASGAHFSLALMVLGVAFSGPYKTEAQVVLAVKSSPSDQMHKAGECIHLGNVEVIMTKLSKGHGPDYHSDFAHLEIRKNRVPAGSTIAERRFYTKRDQNFSRASTIPSLGSEFYATLLEVRGNQALLKVSLNPLINWIWIGATLICLFPMLGMYSRARKED